MSLENRVAVITGASGGLGSLLAQELAAQGVKLALLEREPAKLSALLQSLGRQNGNVLVRVVNLLDAAETQEAAQAVVAQFGQVDILLHVVGGWVGGKTLVESPRADLEFMLNQHIWTSFNVAQAFVPLLIQNRWGRIIMVSSPLAAQPIAKSGPYAIGKAGQEALILTLAQELKGSGVTANLVLVRTIDTQRAKVSTPTAENMNWTTPEEIAAAVMYLLSKEAGTVNGARMPLY